MNNLEKVSLNVHPVVLSDVKRIAKQEGVTVTEIIRRGILLYKYIWSEISTGKQLILRDPETGEAERITFL